MATGESMVCLADQFRLGKSTVCGIIGDTLCAISDVLMDKVLKLPNKTEFLAIAEGFSRRWNFPHCIGAIDGKHIAIEV